MTVRSVDLDGGDWRIARDPENRGRELGWPASVPAEAVPVLIPGVLQETFPAYYGTVWYWRNFAVPAPGSPDDRVLLHFQGADFFCEVWVNGQPAGSHAGGEEPFTFDVTCLVRPDQENALAVRVINVTDKAIDGWSLANTPVGGKVVPFAPGREWNYGGLLDSVELRIVPAIYIDDIHLLPDWRTGEIRAEVTVINTLSRDIDTSFALRVSPEPRGAAAACASAAVSLSAGRNRLAGHLQVPQHRLWDLDTPSLYRVEVRVGQDERAERCGFRDFRFAGGCFRLNGRRIFLKSAHACGLVPITIHANRNPELQMRDLVQTKAMGFNCVRYLCSVAPRRLLDLCDETGLMVMGSSLATWFTRGDNPDMATCYDRSFLGAIRRDRNHPCIVLWYTLNETPDGRPFRHAIDALPKIREADPTRLVLLNSGRFDYLPEIPAGSNPESPVWDITDLDDRHIYLEAPHRRKEIDTLRGKYWPEQPLFLSEYGMGSAMDLLGLTRYFERNNAAGAMDAVHYRSLLERFMADWRRWRLDEVFGRPEDYFRACLSLNAGRRSLGLNAVRANPRLAGYSMTGLVDQGGSGEGPVTLNRIVKPGNFDALSEGFAPLKWCLFVEPQSIYSGDTVEAEVLLANEDRLRPGDYTVRVRLFDPDNRVLLQEEAVLTIPEDRELPFALPVWRKNLPVAGPAGIYRLTADFTAGADATGSTAEFRVFERSAMPPVRTQVALAGGEMADWRDRLTGAGIPCSETGEVVLASGYDAALDYRLLFDALEQGRSVVLLTGAMPAPAAMGPEVSRQWRVFGRYEKDSPDPEKALLRQIPERLELGGIDGERTDLELGDDGCTGDLSTLLWDGDRRELPVWLFTRLAIPRDGVYTFWLAGDWRYQVWLDGETVIDRLAEGNGEAPERLSHAYSWRLAAGEHVLAVKLTSGASGCLTHLRGPVYKGDLPPDPRFTRQLRRLDGVEGLYIRDDWARRHPVFAGLHRGGLLDWRIFRNLSPQNGVCMVPTPEDGEVLAGAINTSSGYDAGVYLFEEKVGRGTLLTTCFDIRGHFGGDPAAELLLRNLLNYAAEKKEAPPESPAAP